jgi:hypothetical protein
LKSINANAIGHAAAIATISSRVNPVSLRLGQKALFNNRDIIVKRA